MIFFGNDDGNGNDSEDVENNDMMVRWGWWWQVYIHDVDDRYTYMMWCGEDTKLDDRVKNLGIKCKSRWWYDDKDEDDDGM